jgi:hemerythrin
MALHWEPRLAVGVPLIDQQHKELIDALNALLTAMATSRGKEEVGKLLKFLGEYTVSHFAAEEQIMTRHRYPGLAAHQTEHEAFIGEFKKLAAEFAKSGPTTSLAIKLNGKVCEWLRDHIGGCDRQLATFVNKAPAAPAPRARVGY